MNKKYRLTYTLHTELGERTCVETFRYFEAVLQVLRNLNNHCKIENIKIEEIQMAEYPNYVVHFYFDDKFKTTVSTEASRTENALIIAFNELLTKTSIVANSYIIYDIENRKTYKGNF